MRCYFCSKTMERTDTSYVTICPHCPHKVKAVIDSNHTAISFLFVVTYQETIYEINFHIGTQTFYLIKDGTDKIVLKLNYFPDINPYNILKKLPTLLTFS